MHVIVNSRSARKTHCNQGAHNFAARSGLPGLGLWLLQRSFVCLVGCRSRVPSCVWGEGRQTPKKQQQKQQKQQLPQFCDQAQFSHSPKMVVSVDLRSRLNSFRFRQPTVSSINMSKHHRRTKRVFVEISDWLVSFSFPHPSG